MRHDSEAPNASRIISAIASATSVEQLTELLPAMDLTLSAAQLDKLDAAGA